MTIGATIALAGVYFGFNCVTHSRIYKNLTSSAEGCFHNSDPIHREFTFKFRPNSKILVLNIAPISVTNSSIISV